MPPPLQGQQAPVETSVRESENTAQVLPHADPTFFGVVQRLDWNRGTWTLKGPTFEDGTRPEFQIEWRLGELVMRFLLRYANAKLSRTQSKELSEGKTLNRVRLVKKTTPAAGSNANQASSEGPHQNHNN